MLVETGLNGAGSCSCKKQISFGPNEKTRCALKSWSRSVGGMLEQISHRVSLSRPMFIFNVHLIRAFFSTKRKRDRKRNCIRASKRGCSTVGIFVNLLVREGSCVRVKSSRVDRSSRENRRRTETQRATGEKTRTRVSSAISWSVKRCA